MVVIFILPNSIFPIFLRSEHPPIRVPVTLPFIVISPIFFILKSPNKLDTIPFSGNIFILPAFSTGRPLFLNISFIVVALRLSNLGKYSILGHL